MELIIEGALSKVEADEAEKINHWVYCHHCRKMGAMAIMGRDAWGRVVFGHLVTGCSGVVRVSTV